MVQTVNPGNSSTSFPTPFQSSSLTHQKLKKIGTGGLEEKTGMDGTYLSRNIATLGPYSLPATV